MIERLRRIGYLILVTAAIAACSSDPGSGDGGGIGGSGLIPITASGVSAGPIAGFGSIIVNGEQFDTLNSEFMIEGENGSQSDLAVGMQIRADVDFDTMSASRIVYEPALLGPVDSVDALNNRLTVLGQPVVVATDTVLDGIALNTLLPGEFVEVSGNRDSRGILRASYLRQAMRRDRVQISGEVSMLDSGMQRFTIGTLQVDYRAANLSMLVNMLTDSTPVIIVASAPSGSAGTSTLLAEEIKPAVLSNIENGSRIELEGIVNEFESVERFSLNGQAIQTDGTTRFTLVDGSAVTATAVKLNSRLEVEGLYDSGGVILASHIVVIPIDDSRLVSRIESLDAGRRSLTVMGVNVFTTSGTRYDGDQEGVVAVTGFENLRIGDYVRVEASFIENRLVATRIRSEELDDEARLRGPVTALDERTSRLEVLGIPIFDGIETEYKIDDSQQIERAIFLEQLRLGDLVEVRWKMFQSTTLPPDDIEVE